MSDQQDQGSQNTFSTQAWLEHKGERSECRLLNLSPAGCLILTSVDLSPGSVFQLQLTLPDNDDAIGIKTVVMAEMMVDEQPAIDARFIELPNEVKAMIRGHVKRSARPTQKIETI